MPSTHTLLPNPVAEAPPNQNQTSKTYPAAAEIQSSCPGIKPPQNDQHQALIKCPRCDSSITKFCYYNNYSLAQPRHFCKTCRRYWTKGGSLRNVPVGGGSRKTKRLKSSSSTSSSSKDFLTDICGLKPTQVVSPALDFQLEGIELPRVNVPVSLTGGIYDTEYHVLGKGSPSSSLGGLNFPLQMAIPSKQLPSPSSSVDPPISTLKIDGNLMSSIESLRCINHDLHWKLHQQRLASLYADSIPRDGRSPSSMSAPQPWNITSGSNSAPMATDLIFGNSTSNPTDNYCNKNTSWNNWRHISNNSNGRDHDQFWGVPEM